MIMLLSIWNSPVKPAAFPALTAWLAFLCASTPAVAHHSFAMYDTTQTVTLDCTVKDFQWTNPHALLWIVERPEDGAQPQEWAIELPTSPGNLSRLGWTKHSLNPGDDIVLEMSPLRDGKHGGSFKKATFKGTGQVLQVILPDPAKSDDKRADK